jgi:tRNA dimethylallyltransferase
MTFPDNANYDKRRPVLIAGPTASGKSALALAVAERDGGCVINADASQVYACWRVLTARPDDAELARAPHALYGHVACSTRYSVGDWLRDVVPAIERARSAGLRPIVVGGTGLYFHALTEGLAAIPEVPPELRARSEAMLDAGGLAEMVAALDAETRARIDLRNPRRVQRAWEVLASTGRGLAHWQEVPHRPAVPRDAAVRVVLDPDISILNHNIKARFERMLQAGALHEVRGFRDAGFDPQSPAGRVLGVAQLLAHLDGPLDRDAAASAAVTATRQFAKRQRTWFRNRMADWTRVGPGADALRRVPAA